jgi:hypothetical protein
MKCRIYFTQRNENQKANIKRQKAKVYSEAKPFFIVWLSFLKALKTTEGRNKTKSSADLLPFDICLLPFDICLLPFDFK